MTPLPEEVKKKIEEKVEDLIDDFYPVKSMHSDIMKGRVTILLTEVYTLRQEEVDGLKNGWGVDKASLKLYFELSKVKKDEIDSLKAEIARLKQELKAEKEGPTWPSGSY